MREAIVLDCEMVACGDHAEIAYLSAIDFLTGEVLIDNHVQLRSKVTKWKTRWGGVSVASMRKAHRDKRPCMVGSRLAAPLEICQRRDRFD